MRPERAKCAPDAAGEALKVDDVGCQTESCQHISAFNWPLSFIQSEQGKDEVLAELARLLATGSCPSRHSVSSAVRPWLRHWSRLRLLDGVIFKVYRSRPQAPEALQVVIPSELVAGVLTSLHAGPCGGHFGHEKLLKQAKRRFFWLGMCSDVEKFCQQCDRCAGRSSPNPPPRASMGELYATEPWEVVSIDFLTDLSTTARGNRHLLVVCDHFTRWVEVFPLPDMLAVTVAETLASQVFSRFGCPKRLHSDCAANFRSQVMSELCRIMGIQKTSTTAFHPQGNSRCERVNRTILGMLAKYLTDNHSEWDRHLPLLMLGYRAQIHRSLGYSPFFLMFGREPNLPIDAEIDSPTTARARSAAEYVDELCSGLRSAYREALSVSDRRHTQNKRLYERKMNEFHYSVGDRAMLFRGVAKRGEYHKFMRPWKPVVIVAKRGDLNYRVRLEDGKMLCVHHNRLKPCTVPSGNTTESDPAASGAADRVSGRSDSAEQAGQSASVTETETAGSPPVAGTSLCPVPGSASEVAMRSAAEPPAEAAVSQGAEQSVGLRVTFRPIPLPRTAVPPVAPRRSTRERRPPDRYVAVM